MKFYRYVIRDINWRNSLDKYWHGYKLHDWHDARKEMRKVLIEIAKGKKTITYSDLCNSIKIIKFEPSSSALANMLGEISEDENNRKGPLLSVLVVHKNGDSMPGQGFFELAIQLGFNFKDREAFWIEQLNLVYGYNWK